MAGGSQITLRPKRICFGLSGMKISDLDCGNYKIPYQEMILAFIGAQDRKSVNYPEPDIMDITKDMEGDVILYDSGHCRWRIQTDLTGITAGMLLTDLAMHAPHIILGGHAWFDVNNEEEFAEAVRMVAIMRCC